MTIAPDDCHEWAQRVVPVESSWAVQAQLEAEGWQVATVASLPEDSSSDFWQLLHACRPPIGYAAARAVLRVRDARDTLPAW